MQDGTAKFVGDNRGEHLSQALTIEQQEDKYFIVSCVTPRNVLQCHKHNGSVRFDNQNRRGWEAFRIE